MIRRLADIKAAGADARCALVALDRSSWHVARVFVLSSEVSLPYPPPYSSELNPMATACQFPKINSFANRISETEELKATVSEAWAGFMRQPTNIVARERGITGINENRTRS